MSKIINKRNYKTVSFGSEGYTNLDAFMDNGGSWKVGASKNLYTALGEPHFVKVLMSDTQVAFKAVPDGTPGAYEFCKGAIIYSTDLAEKIKTLAANTEFKSNATTRCGRIDTIQTDEDGSTIVLLNFD